MNTLLLHHQYSHGVATDLSGFNHHGRVVDCEPGTDAFRGSLRFDLPGSRVDVAPTPKLRDLRALRVRARFNAGGHAGRRLNLVEAQGSFAFYIAQDWSLAGTVMDAGGHWWVVNAPGAITAGRWIDAEFCHDGVGVGWLVVDGRPVGSARVPGPILPVGPRGVTIGHWPEPAGDNTFSGHIHEVWLWGLLPQPEAADPCCPGAGDARWRLRKRAESSASTPRTHAPHSTLSSRRSHPCCGRSTTRGQGRRPVSTAQRSPTPFAATTRRVCWRR